MSIIAARTTMFPQLVNAALIVASAPVGASDQRLPIMIVPFLGPDIEVPISVPSTQFPSREQAPQRTDDVSIQSSLGPEGQSNVPSAGSQKEDDATALSPSTEDIVVSGRRRSSADPLEGINVQSYKMIQAVDGAVVAPLARGYKKGIPKPVRKGLHNFLDNVQEPIVFLNYLLQFKPGKAAETLGRFIVNTTVGLAGVIDVAKKRPFNLPHRTNSLANTLGYYGVGPGPYFFLPLIGPTTLRDLLGTSADRLILPAAVGAPFNKAYYAIPANVVSALDYRVAADERLTELHNAKDPYAATRKDYLERRKVEIDLLHSPKWRARHLPKASTSPQVPAPTAATGVAAEDERPISAPDAGGPLLKP